MRVFDQRDKTIIILDADDFVIRSLVDFAKKANVSGFFIGIGAVKEPTIGFFDISSRKYIRSTLNGEFEVLSLIGNISFDENNNPVVHAHICLGDRSYNVFGGHLFEAKVSVTLEIILMKTDRIFRKIDKEFDLKLISLVKTHS